MKKVCYVFGIFIIFAGFIGAIILADKLGVSIEVVTSGYYYKLTETVTQRNWGVTIGVFIGVLFPCIVLAVMLFAFNNILEKLDAQAAIIDKFTPLLKEMPNEISEKEILSGGGWKCPKCGTANRLYTITCKCGQKRQ